MIPCSSTGFFTKVVLAVSLADVTSPRVESLVLARMEDDGWTDTIKIPFNRGLPRLGKVEEVIFMPTLHLFGLFGAMVTGAKVKSVLSYLSVLHINSSPGTEPTGQDRLLQPTPGSPVSGR